MALSRPNILLFLTDDHGKWAAGCYGDAEIKTPILDRLAAQGALFNNAFTPIPVCSPARACLLTGRTPSQVGIHDWINEGDQAIGDIDYLADEVTLPEILAGLGYTCGLSGKWHLGRSRETPRGFSWCFGLPRWQGQHEGEYTYHQNGEPVTLTGNKTQFITDRAIEFLDAAPADRPFFLNVGYISTHSPYHASFHDPRIVAEYDDASFVDIPTPPPHPWANDEGVSNKPAGRNERRPYYAGYYSAVSEVDHAVGRILRRLDESGQLDNTLVVYVSDHGCALGHQGFWGKGNSTRPQNMHEVSIRIPLIMRWPNRILAGTRVEQCVSHYDTFLTLLEAAQASSTLDSSRNYPGRSYMPILSGPDQAWDNTIIGEYGDLRMARTPVWKLVLRYGHGPDELFDLVNDPDETRNLAGLAETAVVQAALSSRIERFYTTHQSAGKSGLSVADRPPVNGSSPFHDGLRERQFATMASGGDG